MVSSKMTESNYVPLASSVYRGRIVMLGLTPCGRERIVAYALTGRSPSSQARTLRWKEDGSLTTQVTEPTLLAQGNPSLLLYRPVISEGAVQIVGNGSQTEWLLETMQHLLNNQVRVRPLEILMSAHREPHWIQGHEEGVRLDVTRYEPDAPTYTPRICGVLSEDSMAFSLSKRHSREEGQEDTARMFYSMPLRVGSLFMLSTYTGLNVPAGEGLPSFVGEPIEMSVYEETPEDMARALYAALGPSNEIKDALDVRISVAVMWMDRVTGHVRSCVLNRADL